MLKNGLEICREDSRRENQMNCDEMEKELVNFRLTDWDIQPRQCVVFLLHYVDRNIKPKKIQDNFLE